MILRVILVLSLSVVTRQQGLTPGGTHDALSVGRQGSSHSSSSRSTLVNDIRGALNSALDSGRLGSLGSLGGSSSSTQNGVQQEPLPGLESTHQLRSSPGGFPQTVIEAQPGQGGFTSGATDQFGGFGTASQDFGFGGRNENMPTRSQDSTSGGSFLPSGGRSGTAIGTLPSGSDSFTGSSSVIFGASGTTGTLPGSGTGTQTGQGQSFGFGAPPTGFGSPIGPGFAFGSSGTTGTLSVPGTPSQTGQGQSLGFGAPPTGFGSQMGPGFLFGTSGTTGTLSGSLAPGQTSQGQSFGFGTPSTGFGSQSGQGFNFGSSGTTGTLSEPGTGGQTGQGQSIGFGSPPTAFGSQMGAAFPFSTPMDLGSQIPPGGFGMPPTSGGGLGAMTGMTGTFGIRPLLGSGVNVGNMTPPGTGMFMQQGPGPFMMPPTGQGAGVFPSRMSPTGPMFGPGSFGGVIIGAEGSGVGGGMQGFARGTTFPGMPFPLPGATFPGVPGLTGPTPAGGGTSSRFFSPVPGMGLTGGIDQSLATPGVSGFFSGPGFPPGVSGAQQPGTGMFGVTTSTGSGSSTDWQTSGTMSSGIPTSSFPTGAPFPGMTVPGSIGIPSTGTGGSVTSTGGSTDASSGAFPGMAFLPGTGGPILPPGFFVPGGGQVSGGGGSSGRDTFTPDSTRTGSGTTGFSGGSFSPFGDVSFPQGIDPRMIPSGGPGQILTFGPGPIFARRRGMPIDFFIRRR